MAHKPTEEQTACVGAARDSADNLLISARAGAAKTSTLVMIGEALAPMRILCLAFNKKNAEDMEKRLPKNCDSRTLNSIGHRAWGEALGKRLSLSTTKCFDILTKLLEGFTKEEQAEIYDNMGSVLKAIRFSKSCGHIPDNFASDYGPKCARLTDDAEFFELFDEELSANERGLILRTLTKSLDQAFEGLVDFDDQILMPTVFRATFPTYALVMVDEAQDLSELNHAMLAKIVRRRIIAVGDQAQAIYAFRGAHELGMEVLRQRFNMRTLTLSTTFRCPEAICEHVRWRTPDLRSWEGNPSVGEIHHLSQWTLADIPDDAAIICRNNAPLFRYAIQCLRSGRNPKLWGNDIATNLLKVMEKLGPRNMRQEDAIRELDRWKLAQQKKVKNLSALEDRYNCLRVFIDDAPTLGRAIDQCHSVLRSTGRINLMTGHKSKGAEFDHVFFLNQSLVSDEGQDPNLRYVICTRAKKSLTYIDSEGYVS